MTQKNIFCKFLGLLENRLMIYIVSIIMMTTFYAVFEVTGSLFVKSIFDIAEKGNYEDISVTMGFYLLIGIVAVCIASMFMYIYNNEAKKGSIEIKKKVFSKTLNFPMEFYDTHHSGELLSRLIYDTDKASEIYSSRLRRVLAPIISVLVYIIMFIINPAMTLVLVLLNILLFLLNTLISKPMKKVGKESAKKSAIMTEKLSNMLTGIEVNKMYDFMHHNRKKYELANKEYCYVQRERMYLVSILESLNVAFDMLCALLFLVIGIYFLQHQLVSLGDIAAVYTIYAALSLQFLQLGKYYPELMNCISFAERIFSFLDEKEECTEMVNDIQINSTYESSAINIDNLSFQYNVATPVLNQVTITIPKNKNVALIGRSGCGKSTIAKLLLGFYPISSGDIKFFGKSIKELGLENVRALIAYVPQEAYLFETNIIENIRYGKPDATDAEIINAAKLANAHDFIMKQADKYQTMIIGNGHNLSGGEKQRIAMARAIIKNSPIIILDEATSALDNESEFLIQDTITKLKKTKTIITIAHKQATIDFADIVIEL
ncbi:ABC transporter ATP-binding protein [Lachnospira eligens]|uniref:ABC transporter ATP-binding protein n=1 Tax=Lachnospira eligens TaxID=39485 RepID=UPI000E5C82B4|nr:ABC transporter ATP-binding protein [Lachnospira eligens]RGZ70958.1 ABC transporter ATP-binding protein [Lachnospira eligens]